jgi:LysW-gamma-L-lysine carboxypeptidase
MLDWRWEGPLAHSAGQTPSPAEQAFAYWQHVQSYVMARNTGTASLFHRLDATLQEIESGQNGAYGWARMTIGFRLPPALSPGSITTALMPGDGAYLHVYGHELTYLDQKDSTLSRALRGAIRRQDGRPRFVYKTGTSDMNVVGPVWNCPIVAYGPGDSNLDHTPQEHINLDEYGRAIAVLTDVLEHL